MESEEREAEETHPDEPTGNGEPPSEPTSRAESKRAEADDRQQKATDDGMAQRTQRRP